MGGREGETNRKRQGKEEEIKEDGGREEEQEASKDKATKTVSVYPHHCHFSNAIVTLEKRLHLV